MSALVYMVFDNDLILPTKLPYYKILSNEL